MAAAKVKVVLSRMFDPGAILSYRQGRATDVAGVDTRQRQLEKKLDRLLKTATACLMTKALQAKLEQATHQMMTFCLFPSEVKTINNASERNLRPSVIARRVTDGYRAKWSPHNEAAMRTTVYSPPQSSKPIPDNPRHAWLKQAGSLKNRGEGNYSSARRISASARKSPSGYFFR